jgi:hypothetical protein
MARLITRMADLCRHRAAEERFLRRFSTMPVEREDEATADPDGPGWYASSRELEAGLQVCEGTGGALLDAWNEARRLGLAPALARPDGPAGSVGTQAGLTSASTC